MKSYYRIMLGPKSMFADECITNGFIGADYEIHQDLNGYLPESWRDFNKRFIPIFMANRPDKSKNAAGLACGMLWTITKGIRVGDIILSPDGAGQFVIGEAMGDYQYHPNAILPHRRPVRWFDQRIPRTEMSLTLQNSVGSPGTVSNITKHSDEIERLLTGTSAPIPNNVDETVEDAAAFAMEKHLEDFLVRNWAQSGMAHEYDILEDGQQYPTDTGPLDILALSKDKGTLLVIELKRGRASDVVVGQILRYMGYVKEELAEPNQQVRGIIIALEDDQRLRRALSMTSNVEFYRYQISFKLSKV
jgi:restriction system protein